VIPFLSDFGPLAGGPDDMLIGAYESLSRGDCEGVLTSIAHPDWDEPSRSQFRSLYEGAAAACLAAFHNQPNLWSRAARAEGALTSAQPHATQFDCLDMAVYRFLQSLIEVHRQDPEAQLIKGNTEGGGPCPRVLEVIPDHGPRQGGYSVRLVGVNLPPEAGIYFGDHYVTVATQGGREAIITVPPVETALPGYSMDDPAEAVSSVCADGWFYGFLNCATFVYDGAAPRAGPPSDPSTSESAPVSPLPAE